MAYARKRPTKRRSTTAKSRPRATAKRPAARRASGAQVLRIVIEQPSSINASEPANLATKPRRAKF
jgi:hypothetical protein